MGNGLGNRMGTFCGPCRMHEGPLLRALRQFIQQELPESRYGFGIRF